MLCFLLLDWSWFRVLDMRGLTKRGANEPKMRAVFDGSYVDLLPESLRSMTRKLRKVRISSHQRFCCQSSLKRKEVRKIGWKIPKTPSGCPIELMSWSGLKHGSLDHDHNLKILLQNETTPHNNRNAQFGSKAQIQWKQNILRGASSFMAAFESKAI